jgi:hypothetical protein
MRILAISLLAISLAVPSAAKETNGRHSTEQVQLHLKPIILFDSWGATLGPSVGVEVPIHKYFSLGGLFNANFGLSGGFNVILDFDAVAKGFYPLRIGDHDAAVYGSVPIGLSVGVFSALGITGAGAGFNFGIIPGFQFYINDSWGVFTELGFNFHLLRISGATATSPAGQFAIGATYVF